MTQIQFHRPQILRSWSFMRFHNFIWLILRFWRKWSPICENWARVLDSWLYASFGEAKRKKITFHHYWLAFFINWFQYRVSVVIPCILHVAQQLLSLYVHASVSYLLPMIKMLSWTYISHWSKQNIARLTQVKNKGREAWHTIFTTYLRSTGSNLCSWLVNIFIKNVNESTNANTH